ncbi:LysR family transcriptional regulator [Martelella alba]|uniref:LysR family transcriptional regulator n=1 Tax=Martelella alba TaxID=2590451 RepID=A0ABY2SF86_9HYPH|nr:LysR family transcriptional regulator [Martelella alba]TKI03311.1 LysR family transcriptional regulator [Martelella alba]
MAITGPELADPELLQIFLAVAEARNFTAAANRLGIRQSTVSQRIARLESRLERRLFVRDTHSVTLTVQGSALLPYARDVLAASLRLGNYVEGRQNRGRVRFGISEDFASAGLTGVLAEFRRQHADIELELTIALSGVLHERFDAGLLDVIFAKRQKSDLRGRRVWRESLVWIGPVNVYPDPALPLPLILYPPPSITRTLALDALANAGRSWKIVCTSNSMNGLRAGALAGLGFVPHSRRMIPPGLSVIPSSAGLPPLGEIEFVIVGGEDAGTPAAALADSLLSDAARISTASDNLPSV